MDKRISIDALSPEDRQALVEQFFSVATNAYSPAWFSPVVGFTLRRNQKVRAWGSSFDTNALGYRTHPVRKPENVLRVLFLGDSWTFGLGVDEKESFPHQFEVLANRVAEGDRPIEAWNLALPGYNLLNAIGALDAFADRLQPDAVVFCPTPNDNFSSHRVLPQRFRHPIRHRQRQFRRRPSPALPSLVHGLLQVPDTLEDRLLGIGGRGATAARERGAVVGVFHGKMAAGLCASSDRRVGRPRPRT